MLLVSLKLNPASFMFLVGPYKQVLYSFLAQILFTVMFWITLRQYIEHKTAPPEAGIGKFKLVRKHNKQ